MIRRVGNFAVAECPSHTALTATMRFAPNAVGAVPAMAGMKSRDTTRNKPLNLALQKPYRFDDPVSYRAKEKPGHSYTEPVVWSPTCQGENQDGLGSFRTLSRILSISLPPQGLRITRSPDYSPRAGFLREN